MIQIDVRPRVLVVDDEPAWQSAIRRLLQDRNCIVEYAESQSEAINKLSRSEVEFDVVIVNLFLVSSSPIAEGLKVLKKVHELGGSTKCIVLTDLPRLHDALIITNQYGSVVRGMLPKEELGDGEPLRDRFDLALAEARGIRAQQQRPAHQQPLTWLHVSDFHFRTDKTWDSQAVLGDLLTDIGNRTSIDPALEKISLVFITGDLSFSGQSEEYRIAASFLERLRRAAGVPKTRMFIVPGNHDVDRKSILPHASRSLMEDRNKVNDIYHDSVSRTLFLKRLDNYRYFVRNNYRHLCKNENSPYHVIQKTINGMAMFIVGLNTAWTSEGDGEYGKLVLGDAQVREALTPSRKKAGVRISLFHHPLDWLVEFDRDDCQPQLYGACNFLLHGHMHKTEIASLTAPGHQTIVLGAGASYMGRSGPNAYNYVHLDFKEQRGVVYFREYTDRDGGHWTKDTRTYKDAPDGKYEFELPM